MVDYLCECGHTRIALLAPYSNDASVGMLRHMEKEILFDADLIVGQSTTRI